MPTRNNMNWPFGEVRQEYVASILFPFTRSMPTSPLLDYIAQTPADQLDNATVAYLANLTETAKWPRVSRARSSRNWPTSAAT